MLVGAKNCYAETGLKVLPQHLFVRSKESYEKFVVKYHIRGADLNTRLLTSAVDESELSYKKLSSFIFLSYP